ncbi:MAG: F0F1 ATP synthase subunit epsilon [Acidobacteria bacterium]|nr:MAG: F0F1 ATP synthase subunit epsilon [Acidobacteriota bacterium]
MPEALPKSIHLEIVTPDRFFFRGEVGAVTVPAITGYLGILPGHAPLLSELRIGIISYRSGDEEVRLFCSWGFVEVLPDRVSVLAEMIERPDEIDVPRARQKKEEAEKLLRSKSPDVDYEQAVISLEKANTRLEVAGAQSRAA